MWYYEAVMKPILLTGSPYCNIYVDVINKQLVNVPTLVCKPRQFAYNVQWASVETDSRELQAQRLHGFEGIFKNTLVKLSN